MNKKLIKCITIPLLLCAQQSMAEDKQEMAKKLSNPLESIISVPINTNYHPNLGVDDKGSKWLTNIQPIVPLTINDDWKLLTRTILPYVSQDTGVDSVGTIEGVGDMVFTAWLVPEAMTENGWRWGAGTAILLPSGTEVSAKKWGVGPSMIVLKQDNKLTYGAMSNHIWSYAGSDAVTDKISQTLIQPFITYVTDNAMTFSLNTESTYDWQLEAWTVPVTFVASQLVYAGKMPINLGIGATYWAEAPESGPEGWGIKLSMTLVLPKKMFGLK